MVMPIQIYYELRQNCFVLIVLTKLRFNVNCSRKLGILSKAHCQLLSGILIHCAIKSLFSRKGERWVAGRIRLTDSAECTDIFVKHLLHFVIIR